MSLLINTLGIAIIVILAVSLIFTWNLARGHKVTTGEIDTKIAKPIQKNVYMRNPIFFSYGIFFVLLLFIVFFVAMTFFR